MEGVSTSSRGDLYIKTGLTRKVLNVLLRETNTDLTWGKKYQNFMKLWTLVPQKFINESRHLPL